MKNKTKTKTKTKMKNKMKTKTKMKTKKNFTMAPLGRCRNLLKKLNPQKLKSIKIGRKGHKQIQERKHKHFQEK